MPNRCEVKWRDDDNIDKIRTCLKIPSFTRSTVGKFFKVYEKRPRSISPLSRRGLLPRGKCQKVGPLVFDTRRGSFGINRKGQPLFSRGSRAPAQTVHALEDRVGTAIDRSLTMLHRGPSSRPCTLRQRAGRRSHPPRWRKRLVTGARSTFRGVSVTRAAVVWSGEEFRRDAIGGGARRTAACRGWKGG